MPTVLLLTALLGPLALTGHTAAKTSEPKEERPALDGPFLSGCNALTDRDHSNDQMLVLNCIAITLKITRALCCRCLLLFLTRSGYSGRRNKSFLC